jgi:hypothetical protein
MILSAHTQSSHGGVDPVVVAGAAAAFALLATAACRSRAAPSYGRSVGASAVACAAWTMATAALAVLSPLASAYDAGSSLLQHAAAFVASSAAVLGALVVACSVQRRRMATRPVDDGNAAVPPPYPYDLVFDTDDGLLGFIRDGWEARAPTKRPEVVHALLERTVPQGKIEKDESGGAAAAAARRGKVVAFVGARGAGKTFVVNRLYGTRLASGPLVHTRGVGIKWMDDASGAVIVDAGGGLGPVAAGDREALADRRMTETLVEDLVLALADHIVMVIDGLTADGQERIDALARKLARTKRADLFVLHNLTGATTVGEADAMWYERVELPYAAVGHHEPCDAVDQGDDRAGAGRSRHRPYHRPSPCRLFVSESCGVRVCHMRLAREGTPAGETLNAAAYRALRMRLDAIVPLRPFDPYSVVDDFVRRALPLYLRGPVQLAWRAVGIHVGDETVDGDIVCRLCNAGGNGEPSATRAVGSGPPEDVVGLRPKLVRAYTDREATLDAAEFEAPIDVVDHGDRLVVHVDAPGVDSLTVRVCLPPGDAPQFVEVTGVRRADRHMRSSIGAPCADATTTKPSLVDGDDGDAPQGGQRPVPCRDAAHEATVHDNDDAVAARTAQLVWPTPPARRFGNLYARVTMPPGSCLDKESVRADKGVLRFVILRQTGSSEVVARA